MTTKHFIPDSEYMERLILAIKRNADRDSQGYALLIFKERIERTLEGLPEECRDEFISIANEFGYAPLRYHGDPAAPANDDNYD